MEITITSKIKFMTNIKGLIFDCDGTLADTMPLHWHAWQMITRGTICTFPKTGFIRSAACRRAIF